MNASTTSTEQRTAEQETKYKRLYEDAMKRVRKLVLKKVNPDKEGLQRLIESFDEYFDPITDLAIERAREMTTPNRFADEEVPSNYTYPPEYRILPIEEQIKKLAEIFGLSPADALAYAKSIAIKPLNGGEGRFAIVSDAGLAKLFPNATDPAERFCLGTNLVFEKIEATGRPFFNNRKNQLTKDRLRRHAKTTVAYEKIALEQKGDIWIIDAQLGFNHRGKSVRRARVCFAGNEYGLDPIAGGSIALTHPERFVRSSELDMDLPGSEFAPGADGIFSESPYLYFYSRLEFDANVLDDPYDCDGSASGFTSPACADRR